MPFKKLESEVVVSSTPHLLKKFTSLMMNKMGHDRVQYKIDTRRGEKTTIVLEVRGVAYGTEEHVREFIEKGGFVATKFRISKSQRGDIIISVRKWDTFNNIDAEFELVNIVTKQKDTIMTSQYCSIDSDGASLLAHTTCTSRTGMHWETYSVYSRKIGEKNIQISCRRSTGRGNTYYEENYQ